VRSKVSWMLLKLTGQFFNPIYDLRVVLREIVAAIRNIILLTDYSNELIFKKNFEVASLMIETVENIYPKLKSRGVNEILVVNLEDGIAIWKFLIKNISIDFDNHAVDYDSLFRTFHEIRCIFKMNQSFEKASRLSKLCSLLWLYLHRLYMADCSIIFDYHHHHKPLIISLIKEVGYWFWDPYDGYGEFNSNRLSSYFKDLYKDKGDLNHLNLIMGILNTSKHPNSEELLVAQVPKKFFLSFFELTRFWNDTFEKAYSFKAWNYKAFAELENYLKRNGFEFRYYY
jgi:hypothetical protein